MTVLSRSLIVAQMNPWPVTRGAQHRLRQVVLALAEMGEVDLAWIDAEGTGRTTPPGDVRLGDVRPLQPPAVRDPGLASRAGWLTRSDLPIEIHRRDLTALREDLAAVLRKRYDFIWFSRPMTYLPVAGTVEPPCVVDLDDLEGQRTLAQMAIRVNDLERGTVVRRLAHVPRAAQARLNAARWRALERRVASEVAVVTVCSELDRDRLSGIPNVAVVPNGYPSDAVSYQLEARTDGHLLLQGSLTYAPNADAARWFVESILPSIRRDVPHVRLRLVGRTGHGVRRLHSPPTVEVTGFVDDIDSELSGASVVVVPIRFGSGTRVKILEAFAAGVPVVTTSAGVEGIDAVDGVHVLVADTPEGFSHACRRLLKDPSFGRRLAESAHALYLERYTDNTQRAAVRDVVEMAMARRADPERHMSTATHR